MELQEQVKGQEKLLKATTKGSRSYQYKLVVAKSTYSDGCDHLKLVAEDLKRKVESFNQSVLDSEDSYDCLLERLHELENHSFETKEHKRKYLDNMRQCCIELLSMNVGINNVKPVIRCVLKHIRCVLKHIASFEIKDDTSSNPC